MVEIKLRDYQEAAVNQAISYYRKERDCTCNPLEVLPTGAGKSVISAALFNRLAVFPENKFMLLTHNSELVKQNAEKIRLMCPKSTVGIYSASLGSKDKKADIVCGTVQSVYKALKKNSNAFGKRALLVIDEAHLLSSKENSMYRIAINALKEVNPRMRMLGLSATPYRLDCGLLTEQEDAIFTDICYDMSKEMPKLIEQGYLAPLDTLSQPLKTAPDLSKVKVIGGDFNSGQLDKLFNQEEMLNEACNIMVATAKDRKAWLVFVSGIASAIGVSEALNLRGINTAAVHSKNTKEENAKAISEFRAGELQCLVSADQLTTGFDVPKVDFIGMLRPTMSPSLHVQMLGRGMRPCEGKTDCLVLDFVRNLKRLGPVNNPHIPDPKANYIDDVLDTDESRPHVVTCPSCGFEYSIESYICPECGTLRMRISQEMDFEDLSSTEAIDYSIGGTKVQEEDSGHTVLNMVHSAHKAKSGKYCIRLDFVCKKGFKPYHIMAFLNFDLEGWPYKEACRLWKMLQGKDYCPLSTAEAWARISELKRPKSIEAERRAPQLGRKFDKIKGAYF